MKTASLYILRIAEMRRPNSRQFVSDEVTVRCRYPPE